MDNYNLNNSYAAFDDGNLEITNATIERCLALADLRPSWSTLVPYASLSQVTLHRALKALSAGSGYDTWTRVKNHLQAIHNSEGRRSSVLDVGTGTGVWAYELGDEEAFTDVIGVDVDLSLVGVNVESDQRHANIDFAQLDVVHIRNLASGIPNYQLLIERCARILRTGGMLVVTELELFYHASSPSYSPSTCLRIWQTALRESLKAKGIDPDVAVKLSEPDLIVEEIGVPAGGADALPDHFDRPMIQANFQAMEPTLLEHGYAASEIAALNRDCLAELTAIDSRYFQRIITVCAHKRRY
ncbi:hypothetical protein QFC21_001481 [Naganishia friedmannii]|uniref:Uncharacterized protein n=1 Tax=Naganishia friedmannii TaxID=89922 RepID=A0ACC2W5F2_9TREE|nr:hypothetical protein QFC21_001481 [Naganishia friedmannii]